MGCDIHMVLERRKKGATKWIGVYVTDALPGDRIKIASRDYHFFAEVASVRGTTSLGNYAHFLPEDVSDLAWQQFQESPTDYHHASHLTVPKFLEAYRKSRPPKDDEQPEFDAYRLLGIDAWPEDYEFRVVFWFDN